MSDMGTIQNNGGNEWLIDYGIDDVEPQAVDFLWTSTQLADYANVSCAIVGTDPQKKEEGCKESPSLKKRNRSESCAQPGTKACREKMRRDRLNDRFSELSSILDPERPPKSDKVAILIDATRRLKQLNHEAQMLMESNKALQENIKKLKEEKMELRDDKARLKLEKEWVEQALKGLSGPSPFPPYPAMFPVTFSKASTYPAYPPVPMWQWLPPAAMDTSQDHVMRPPVA